MSHAGGQLTDRAQFVRLGHQFLSHSALSHIAQEQQHPRDAAVLPKRRGVRFDIADCAVGPNRANFKLGLFTGNRALKIRARQVARFRGNEFVEVAPGQHH